MKGDKIMLKIKLEYEIKKKGYGISEFCQKIHMPRSTFYKKCIGTSEFTLPELKRIVDILEIDNPNSIFFE